MTDYINKHKKLCNFKSEIESEISKNYSILMSLFKIMIDHIETMEQGSMFLELLIESPLFDLEDNAKEIYKNILIEHNSKIVSLQDVFHLMKNNNEVSFEFLNKVFNNIFISANNKSPLQNEWLYNYAVKVYPIVNEMKEIYKEQKYAKTYSDFEAKFRTRITLARKVSVKRTIEEITTVEQSHIEKNYDMNTSRKKQKKRKEYASSIKEIFESKELDELILDKLNKVDWEDFISKNVNNILNEKLDEKLNKKLDEKICILKNEYDTKIILLNSKYDTLLSKFNTLNIYNIEKSIETANDKLQSLLKNIYDNQKVFDDIKSIQNTLSDIRKSIRKNITSANRNFEQFIKINENYIKSSKDDLLAEINNLKDYVNTLQSDTLRIKEEIIKYKNEFNDKKNNYYKKIRDTYNLFSNRIDETTVEVSKKKDEVFLSFESIKNDVNGRIKEMTNFVKEYHTKMAAAMAGNAFSLL